MEFKFPKGALITISIILASIVLISKSAITIGSGERGVLYKWIGGVVTDSPPLGEGFNLVCPAFRYSRFDHP